ncbi:MAG: hypothetical protein MRZ79_26385 [Bacteroidia bacterium]|nr:hypothetical protein [Bacteroidia bacterium]
MNPKLKRFFRAFAFLGIAIVSLSHIDYLYRIDLKNCYKVYGRISSIEKVYRDGGGYRLFLEDGSEFRIQGQASKAIAHPQFEYFVVIGAEVELYILQNSYQGMIEKLNRYKNPVQMSSQGIAILQIESLKKQLWYLPYLSIILAILFLILGGGEIAFALKKDQ